jgi:hypothetical protein
MRSTVLPIKASVERCRSQKFYSVIDNDITFDGILLQPFHRHTMITHGNSGPIHVLITSIDNHTLTIAKIMVSSLKQWGRK